MKTLLERVGGFAQKKPTPVKRGGASYDSTYKFCQRGLKLCIWMYRRLRVEDQTARLIRDVMDYLLRRYHIYSIKENIGAHYYEKGLTHDAKTDFEHVVPASVARDLLLYDRLTVDEALNIPTCRLSASKHQILNSTKLVSTTPDIYWFWQRYKGLSIAVETHDGTAVDMATWNLDTHYEHFKG
jgi:uncharacterized protein (DUF2164 family)